MNPRLTALQAAPFAALVSDLGAIGGTRTRKRWVLNPADIPVLYYRENYAGLLADRDGFGALSWAFNYSHDRL